MLRFYGPVNPMGSCRARSVYLTTHLLGRLSPLTSIVHIPSPETDNYRKGVRVNNNVAIINGYIFYKIVLKFCESSAMKTCLEK